MLVLRMREEGGRPAQDTILPSRIENRAQARILRFAQDGSTVEYRTTYIIPGARGYRYDMMFSFRTNIITTYYTVSDEL
jgi:hypothetical protein